MLFYRALNKDGKLQVRGTQGEIVKINKDFDTWEFPTAKAEILEVLQDLVDRAENVTTAPGTTEVIYQIDPRLHCPKCKQSQKGALFLAEYRIQQLFAEKLSELPDASIPRAVEILVGRVMEITQKAKEALKEKPHVDRNEHADGQTDRPAE